MEYTKSEWKLHGLTIETHYSPNGHVIACMNDIGNKVQADAQLIAAAPAMYEALKAMEEIFEALYSVGQPQYGVIPFYTERHQKVKQALAKAEGK